MGRATPGPTAARTTAASAALGVAASAPAYGSNEIAATPCTNPAARDVAPVRRASIDRLNDAPQGPPRNAPDATDATPCAASSRSGDHAWPFSASNALHTDTLWRKSTAAKTTDDLASAAHDPP